eukprot:8073745-Pyramimonas_sp.AAC.1
MICLDGLLLYGSSSFMCCISSLCRMSSQAACSRGRNIDRRHRPPPPPRRAPRLCRRRRPRRYPRARAI